MAEQDKPLWRTGREDTRAIFRLGVCQGRMNDTETASVIVRVMNGQAAQAALYCADEQTRVAHDMATLKTRLVKALSDYDGANAGDVLAEIRDLL